MKITSTIKTILIGLTVSFYTITAQAQLNIVATTGMIADLTKNIGGDVVTVDSLMGTGVDPHLYKATQGDLRKLMKADIIFYNGLHLEGKMQDIFEKMARKKAVYAVADNLPEQKIIYHGKHSDPHVWFDIQLWLKVGENVLTALIKNDPTNQAQFEQNAATYFKVLTELDQWTAQQIKSIPEQQRILITAHDAFGYFGQAYGLQVRGLQGVSTAAEFGLQDIKQLKDIIVANQIKAVFVESSVSPRFIQSLVKGVQAEGNTLTVGGELFSDAMGLANTPEGNYVGMVTHNVKTIVNALKGDALHE